MNPSKARPPLFLATLAGCAGLAAALWVALRVPPPPAGLWGIAALLGAMAGLALRLSDPPGSRGRFSLDLAFLLTSLVLLPSPLPSVAGALAGLLGRLPLMAARRDGGITAARATVRMILAAGRRSGLLLAAGAADSAAGFVPGPAGQSLEPILALRIGGLFLLTWGLDLGIGAALAASRGDAVAARLLTRLREQLPLEVACVPLALLMLATLEGLGRPAFLLLSGCILASGLLVRGLRSACDEAQRAGEELALKAAEVRALDKIGREILASLDLPRVFQVIHEQVARLADASTFSVALFDKKAGEIEHVFVKGQGPAMPGFRFPLGPDPLSWAIKSNRPCHQRPGDPIRRPLDGTGLETSALSVLAAPLTRPDGEVMGVLTLGSRDPSAYGPRHADLLRHLAQHAAIAIDNARYYERATVDPGTGLHLKDHFLRRLAEEIARARRYERHFTLLMMDLDGFKQINDEHGHQAGDLLLREVGDVIRSALRSHDVASRYGGEEFAVMLPETGSQEAIQIAERIRGKVARIRLRHEGRPIAVTISIGLACFPLAGRRGTDHLVREADRALYEAKRQGKDRVVMAA